MPVIQERAATEPVRTARRCNGIRPLEDAGEAG
jgi:hypothetical protein